MKTFESTEHEVNFTLKVSSFVVADEHVTSCYVAISIMTSLVVGLAFLTRCTIKNTMKESLSDSLISVSPTVAFIDF